MKLLVNSATRAIHDASNRGAWSVPTGYEIVEVPGDAEDFVWPNGAPSRCKLDIDGVTIIVNPAWVAPPDRKGNLQTVLTAMEGDNTLPARLRVFATRLREYINGS